MAETDNLLSLPIISEMNKQFMLEQKCDKFENLFLELDTLGSGSFGKVK